MRRPGPALATAAVGALTLWSLADANFLYDAPRPDQDPAHRRETMLSYVQSTYDINKVMDRIEDVGKQLGTGKQTRLAVSGNATWPFSWYLRDYPVNWAANLRDIDVPVLIVDKEVGKVARQGAARHVREGAVPDSRLVGAEHADHPAAGDAG